MGCIYHSVRVTDSSTEVPSLQSIPIVKSSQKFFLMFNLESLLRKKKFGINIIPDTHPISVPLYRMALTELRELREQLKDKLDKCYI